MDSNLIAALVGAVAAFGLTAASALVSSWFSNRQQAQSVRTLLSIEIEQNLELANEFWSKIKNLNDGHVYDEPELCSRMISLPLPKFSDKVFNSQLPLLTSALKPNQIKQTCLFYDNLNRISPIYSKLDFLYKSYQDSFTSSGILARHADMRFSQNAPQIWDEVEAFFTSILVTGNPLQSKSKK